jgi:hypothetical protein
MTLVRTLLADMCGERALGFLPGPGADEAGEAMIYGGPVERIDAWGGAALRCLIEHRARHLQRRVVISPCKDEAAWDLLHALVRKDCPAHLVLTDDCKEHGEHPPPEVLLQAQPVASVEKAHDLAGELLGASQRKLEEPARFAAKYLPELVSNAFRHARVRTVPPVVCAFFDQPNSSLQFVVVDIGRRRRAFTQKSLAEKVLASKEASLASLVDHAAERSLEVELTVAAGSGRLRWQGGSWLRATAEQIPGFCSAITVRV